jgi:hypothetical protein
MFGFLMRRKKSSKSVTPTSATIVSGDAPSKLAEALRQMDEAVIGKRLNREHIRRTSEVVKMLPATVGFKR